MQTQVRELLLQVLSDLEIEDGQVARALTSSDGVDSRDPETLEMSKNYLREHLPTATVEVIEDYLAKEAEKLPITEIYGPIESLDLRTEEELGTIFADREGGWNTFRQKFPRSHGALEISRAGFSPDGTQGIISVGQTSDWMAGHGTYYLYEKTESGWAQKHATMAWIS